MTRKITPGKYEASLTAARKGGGEENQSHWQARLKTVMKRREKSVKKRASR
jgi:hypothetical protein